VPTAVISGRVSDRNSRLQSPCLCWPVIFRRCHISELSIQDFAAIAEILGAIAVVASLIYLGRQIHQTNAQSQAEARYSFVDAYGQMNLTVAENKELASVFRRGMQGVELDDDEAIQFFAFMGQFLNTWTVLFDLHIEHQLPVTQWTVIRKDIITLLSTPGGRLVRAFV